MDLLASYDDENTGDNSLSHSPKPKEVKPKANLAPNVLENEWLSFEQMIAPGGNTEPVKSSDFLVDGIVAYPSMKGQQNTTVTGGGLALEEQSSASSDSEAEADKPKSSDDSVARTLNELATVKAEEEDDDAFFKLRKQVKERDRSSSSDRSGSTGSSLPSSRSSSPSPPHLSPVNSIKSHTSDPPELTEREGNDNKTKATTDALPQNKMEDGSSQVSDKKKRARSKDRKRSKSRDRKRSHRSKHDHSSKSKRRRSRSRSKDRRSRRSRDRHRHKDKKSQDRKSSKDEKRSRSRERKDSKSESRKSEGRDRKDSTIEKNETSTEIVPEIKDSKDSKYEGSRKRSRSRDRKDRKKDRRSRSRRRHRSKSRDRHSRDRKRSRSKERRRSRSRDRKRKHRSRSRDRRSRSRHRSRDRHSRSRSRERLRSRSPVMGRKLTFKEQMRKEFINASKEMSNQEHKVTDLDSLRKPGEALRPSDLLKGVKLNSGESVTPQMALIQTMAAMHKKAQELTGVEVPKYYNPAAVNPLKYAEQVQKRKLLWSKKTDEKEKNDQMETQWKSAFVASDNNRTASKFRKLMGMKEGEGQSSTEEMPEEMQKLSEEQQRKQAELFQRLDQDYQFARMTTHTQRGVGLGFSTTIIDPNHPQNPP